LLDSNRYILDGHTPVREDDLMAWARWMQTADRHVALTEHELFTVSTVFLGLDHSFGHGPPLLFESMAFDRMPHIDGLAIQVGKALDDECERYSTWNKAEIGHKAMVERMLAIAREAAALGIRP